MSFVADLTERYRGVRQRLMPPPRRPRPVVEPPRPIVVMETKTIAEIVGQVGRRLAGADAMPIPARVRRIQRVVAERFDITVQELIGKSRHHGLIAPRHIAMYLAKQLTTLSYPQIGRMFGGRDHTSIIYAVGKVGEMINDPSQVALVTRILESELSEEFRSGRN